MAIRAQQGRDDRDTPAGECRQVVKNEVGEVESRRLVSLARLDAVCSREPFARRGELETEAGEVTDASTKSTHGVRDEPLRRRVRSTCASVGSSAAARQTDRA